MLNISKPLTAGKIKEYFKEEYGAAENAYFSQGGAIRGEWLGRLVETLGLEHYVNAEAFDRLAEGQHPVTGEQLIQHKDTIKTQSGQEVGHRAGWDLTFSAPKTVSLTALVGEDQRIREAHRTAVRAALEEIERYVQARVSSSGPAHTTGKLIAATFEHDTARPVNGYAAPQLHTHVIVFNLTDVNGRPYSLQPYELFKVQAMATAVYQNVLERQIRAAGYQIERGKNHAPEIKGYSAEYLDAESQRAALVRQALEAKGLHGAEAASLAAHAGREEKLKLSPAELKALHKDHAAQFGNQPGQVVAEASQHHQREWSAEKAIERAAKAVAFARERLAERSQILEYFEIVRDALRHVQGRATLADVKTAIAASQATGQLQEVNHVRPFAPAHRYTTPEAVEAERQVLQIVKAGQGQVKPLGVTEGYVEQRFAHLNEDQHALILSALNAQDAVTGVQGKAGTGKTTALAAIRELAEEQGYKALGLGPSSRATKGLREAGMDAENLAAHLARGGPETPDARPRFFFVDESSLSSTRALRDFLQTLESSDRVLLIGDTRQHQSVEAGRIFEQLQDAGMKTTTLSKIVRQKDEGLRQAVELLSSGRIVEAVHLLQQQGRIIEVQNRAERFQAMSKAYAEAAEGTVTFTPDNQSRQELNHPVRAQLRKTGHVKEDAFVASILVNRQALTAADKSRAGSYQIGDSVYYRNGSENWHIERKTYARVIARNEEVNSVTVQLTGGRTVSYDPARLKGVSIYSPEARPLAVGDRIQFTQPWKDERIANRELATVTYLDAAGNIRVRLDDSERSVSWNLNRHAHIDYAYAMTSHAGQGATVDRALVHIDTGDSKARALIDQTLAYVAGSRPRYDLRIFTDNAAELARALSRQHKNETALSAQQTKDVFQESQRKQPQQSEDVAAAQHLSM